MEFLTSIFFFLSSDFFNLPSYLAIQKCEKTLYLY